MGVLQDDVGLLQRTGAGCCGRADAVGHSQQCVDSGQRLISGNRLCRGGSRRMVAHARMSTDDLDQSHSTVEFIRDLPYGHGGCAQGTGHVPCLTRHRRRLSQACEETGTVGLTLDTLDHVACADQWVTACAGQRPDPVGMATQLLQREGTHRGRVTVQPASGFGVGQTGFDLANVQQGLFVQSGSTLITVGLGSAGLFDHDFGLRIHQPRFGFRPMAARGNRHRSDDPKDRKQSTCPVPHPRPPRLTTSSPKACGDIVQGLIQRVAAIVLLARE